jgi:Protein of unknown function (DUF4232)
MTLLAPPGRPLAPAQPVTAAAGRRSTPVRLARASAVALCVGVLSAGLLTAACSGPAVHLQAGSRGAGRRSASVSQTAAASTTPTARSSSPPAGSSAPSPSPAPSVTGVPVPTPLAQCSTGALRVSVGPANGAAGSIYYPLDFTNVSAAACGMYGYPGVSFVSAPGGSELGGAAVRNRTFAPSLVTLEPGAVAHASVQVAIAQNYPAPICKPVTAHWLRVYPPGQFAPLYASLTAVTCTGAIPSGSTLGIYVVRPGANGP